MEAIWKDIKGHEGRYQVSNLGEVRSLDRIDTKSGRNRRLKGKLLKTSISKCGYKMVYIDGEYRYVHRLVCETFIPNPCNYPCVNHRDECKTNNALDNLEWCSYKYNNKYGTKPNRISSSHKGITFTEEHKRKISEGNRGKVRSEETKQAIGAKNKGREPFCKGKKRVYREDGTYYYTNKD